MNVTVIGGTGLIGRMLVARLRALGHQVLAASRSTGVNTFFGQGVAEAVKAAEIVIDVSSSGYLDAQGMEDFFERSTANLIAAEREAGTRHHVVLSVVGTDRLDSGYFRAKAVQEEIVARSGVPFTIVRSTPFFEYIYAIVDAGGEGGDIRLPPVLMQPIAADDVARALACVSLQPPAISACFEIAGPDTYRLPTLAEEILTANEDGRRVISDPEAPYFGARIGDVSLTPRGKPRWCPTSFEDWLRQSLVPISARRFDGSPGAFRPRLDGETLDVG